MVGLGSCRTPLPFWAWSPKDSVAELQSAVDTLGPVVSPTGRGHGRSNSVAPFTRPERKLKQLAKDGGIRAAENLKTNTRAAFDNVSPLDVKVVSALTNSQYDTSRQAQPARYVHEARLARI